MTFDKRVLLLIAVCVCISAPAFSEDEQHTEAAAAGRSAGAKNAKPAGVADTPKAADTPKEEPPHFPAWEIRVIGNTVLPAKTVEAAVYPFLGPDRTIKDIEAAKEALAAAYRDAGFGTVYVDIPEQSVDDGIVRLKVTEGRIDRLHVTGARYFANGAIKEKLPALHRGGVLNTKELQTQLTSVNTQNRDLAVTPLLRAGRTPGTVDVDLKVSDTLPLHGDVQLDDRYTPDTSHTRLSVDLTYGNLFQENQSLSLQFQTAPTETREAKVYAATYLLPLGPEGNILALYGIKSDSNVATIGTLAVLGRGKIFGGHYIIPFANSPALSNSFTLGIDYKDFNEAVLLPDQPGAETPISYINWSVGYAATWRGENRYTTATAAVNFGLRGVANSSDEFHFKRFAGQPNKGLPDYFSVRLGLETDQPLFAGFHGFVRVNGQYSADPLIDNEQYSVGGMDTVRGYFEAEALGDRGVSGALELRSPHLARTLFGSSADVYFILFGDVGVVGINDPLPSQLQRISLASTGAGFTFNVLRQLHGSFFWARALHTATRTHAGDSRVVFEVKYGF